MTEGNGQGTRHGGELKTAGSVLLSLNREVRGKCTTNELRHTPIDFIVFLVRYWYLIQLPLKKEELLSVGKCGMFLPF